MLGGAIAVILLGQITPISALESINYDVILFLFGTFVVGEALSRSGALNPLSEKIFCKSSSAFSFYLILIFAAGMLSALLMNDTVAIIGTVFVLGISKRLNIPAEMLLLALAFSVTTGSVASPIGNPQNLLIAEFSGLLNPFLAFGYYLLVPTLLSLLMIYPVMRIFYPSFASFDPTGKTGSAHLMPYDAKLAKIAVFSFAILIMMILLKIIAGLFGMSAFLPLTLIALAGAVPVILLSEKRAEVLKGIDWHTLVFFAAMFVLMQSVWDSGFFQGMMGVSGDLFSSTGGIFAAGLIISQFISNVPFVALFLPLVEMSGATTAVYMALAAGSTLAGNLLIFGAASNIIIIQNAEKRGERIGFLRFARVGIPLTVVQSVVYIAWLSFI